MTKIKICGLKRFEDIEAVNELKPDYCGFIVDFPKSPRSISVKQLEGLTGKLDRTSINAVGVFVNADINMISGLLEGDIIDIAQLHGDEDAEYIRKLKKMTDKKIIKAFRIKTAEDIKEAYKSEADYILLDHGQGSGSGFEWSLIDEYRQIKTREWFLAGGLNEENTGEAIMRYHPFAVDLSSAVETDGVKDKEKIERIIRIVRNI